MLYLYVKIKNLTIRMMTCREGGKNMRIFIIFITQLLILSQ